MIKGEDTVAITKLNSHVSDFAEIPFSMVFNILQCIAMTSTIIANIVCVMQNSHKPVAHRLSGLLPVVVIFAYMFSALKFTTAAWESPALLIFSSGPFFSLCSSRLIIGSVSKTPFYLFEHLHLSFPILLAIVFLPFNYYFLHLNEYVILLSLIAMSLLNSAWYTTNVVAQITECLDIYCLSIKHKKVE